MDGDRPDIDDDDVVPRVDYVDRERDGRLARYTAAATWAPEEDRLKTRIHAGSYLSRNVSNIPSTSWENADSNRSPLPPFGTLWTHVEDPIASAHECEELHDEMPSLGPKPRTTGLGTGIREKFQNTVLKKISGKSAGTPFADTNKTTCRSVKFGRDTATAARTKDSNTAISGARDDKTNPTGQTKPSERHNFYSQLAASRRPQVQATPANVRFRTPARSHDVKVKTQTHLYKALSDDKERDTEHHDSESIDEILSSGSDSDANNGRGKTDGITSLGLMHMHMGGLGLMSAFTRLHEFTAPTVHLANMTGMVASAVPEKQNFRQTCRFDRSELDVRLRRVISKAQHSQFAATPAQDPPNQLSLRSAVFVEDNPSDKECAWVSFLEFTLVGEPRVETGLWLWSCTLSRGGELNQDDSQREMYDIRAMAGDRPCCRSTREHEHVGNMLTASTTVAFIAMRAGELKLVSGAQLRVRPPWHELEVGPTKATGFERQRVFLVTRASVEVVPT